MAFSFIRTLIASATPPLASMKRQAKRLKKAAPEVFGTDYPLSTCQEAMARANGYRDWQEVSRLLSRIGLDRSVPFWRVHSRNDAHLAVLSALHTLELETRRDVPLAFLGDPAHAALPAACLWVEEISHQRVPGLVLVESDQATVNDTPLWGAVETLGLAELFLQFRFVDVRQRQLGVAISATPQNWGFSVLGALSDADRAQLESHGCHQVFKTAIGHFGQMRGRTGCEEVSVDAVVKAARLLHQPSAYVPMVIANMEGHARTSMEIDSGRYLEDRPLEAVSNLKSLLDAAGERHSDLGVILHHESKYRPVVVMFSRKDPVSMLFAGAIHAMYYWQYVGTDSTRPILYFSDGKPGWLPWLLNFGTRTIIVDGSESGDGPQWNEVTTRRALFASAGEGWVATAGKRCSLAEE